MKQYFLGALALTLAIGFSSFKAINTKAKTTVFFYEYTSSDQSISARTTAANYTEVASDPECLDNTNVCAIISNTDFGPTPTFDGSTFTFDGSGFAVNGSAFAGLEKKN